MRALLLAGSLFLAACASTPAPMYVPTPAGRLHVFESGDAAGIPILFIHGNGGNLTQWGGQIGHFSRSHRVVTFDLRGMGNSEIPSDGVYTIPAMAEDVHAVANALNLDRFVLVGHSYGGSVAAAYAAAHPERVAGVVYADSAGAVVAGPEEWQDYLQALRMDKNAMVREAYDPMLATASRAVKEAVLLSTDQTFVETYVEALEDLGDFDVRTAVARYRGPVLAIAAVETPMSFHVQFPDVPLRRMTGVGHWLMMERPGEFNRILDEFLTTITR